MTLRVLSVVGARPQFVKAAAVSRAIAAHDGVTEIMVHTGQHFDHDMSQVFFEELDIPTPQHQLDIHGGSHGEMTGRMLPALEAVMQSEVPDLVLVYGDTNSTLAGALAAAKIHLPVVHVEAGLRSFNRRMPEELNRVLTDHLSALLLCPTRSAVDNLAKEGVREGVLHVGDVMYDASLFAAERARDRSRVLETLSLEPGTFSVATVHRAENTDDADSLQAVIGFLQHETETGPVVLPLHPRTRAACDRFGVSLAGLTIVDPLGYLDMTRLVGASKGVFTDSGGLQKEAYFHGVPCVTLRTETEWVETVDSGWNRLWSGPPHAERRAIDDYGVGDAATVIVDELVTRFPVVGAVV
jgi:UDP-GlcNAc3NAcA epimerase